MDRKEKPSVLHRRVLLVGMFLWAMLVGTDLLAATITFEEPIFAPETVIQQYCDQGVEFPDGVRIFTPQVETASPGHAATNHDLGDEFGWSRPLNIMFASGQQSVSVKVGLNEDHPGMSLGITASMYAYSGSIPGDGFLTYSTVSLGNMKTPIKKPLTVTSPEANIRSVTIVLEGALPGQYLAEIIDDLSFTDSGVACGAPDTRGPTVTISEPATAGQAVYGPSVLLGFGATDDVGVAKVQVSFLDNGSNELDSFYVCGGPATPSCPQPSKKLSYAFYTWLPKGYEAGTYPVQIRVKAWDFEGHEGEAKRGIIYYQPGPVNLWAMGMEVTQATQPWVAVNSNPNLQQPPSFSYALQLAYGNTVPLVANRTTVVRLYPDVVSPNGNAVGDVSGVLRCFTDENFTNPCPGAASVKPTAMVFLNASASSLDKIKVHPGLSLDTKRRILLQSLNFTLPKEWVEPGRIFLEAEVLPPTGLTECYGCDNGANRIRVSYVDFNSVPNFGDKLVHLVAIDRTLDGAPSTSAPSNGSIQAHVDAIRKLYPVDETTLPIYPQGRFWFKDKSTSTDRGTDLLNALEAAFPDKAGKAAVYSIVDKGFPAAGLGRYNGYAFGNEGGPDSGPHETGHAFGLLHAGPPPGHGAGCNPLVENCAECASGDACDADWPWPHGKIGAFGFDVFSFVVVPPSRLECEVTGACDNWINDDDDYWPNGKPMIDEDQAGAGKGTDWHNYPHDMMSYGGNDWISPRNWTKLFNKFTNSDYHYYPGSASNASYSGLTVPSQVSGSSYGQSLLARTENFFRLPGATGNYILVRGRMPQVNGTGGWVLYPAYQLAMPVGLHDETGEGEFSIKLLGSQGEVLSERRFDVPVQHVDEIEYGYKTGRQSVPEFSELIPMPEGVKSLVLSSQGVPLSTILRSSSGPEVTIISPGSSGFEGEPDSPRVRWGGRDNDWDQVYYMVQYSSGLNEASEREWETIGVDLTGETLSVVTESLKGGELAMVRILATDRLNTTEAYSPTFQVPDKAPIVQIMSPMRPVRMEQGRRFVIRGTGSDLEDGTLQGSSLDWSSDIDGYLGPGDQLDLALLSPGSHEVSLRGVDAAGQEGKASLAVIVRERVNTQPVADAGPDLTPSIGVTVTLDRGSSHDPDDDPLTFLWTLVSQPPGSNPHIGSPEGAATEFSADVSGEYVIQLVVHDGSIASLPDRVSVKFENKAPEANAGPDISAFAGSKCSASVTLDGSLSKDPNSTPVTNDDIVTYEWFEAGVSIGSGRSISHTFGLGTHKITLDVTDSTNLTDTDDVVVNVLDKSAPAVTLSVNPAKLWPANHGMVPISVNVVATDNCDATPVCRITSVSSNEPVSGLGDGDMSPDWEITGKLNLKLRAERSGKGSGRLYTVEVACSDSAGNTSTTTASVSVPHNL
jgi:hypothetical protein